MKSGNVKTNVELEKDKVKSKKYLKFLKVF